LVTPKNQPVNITTNPPIVSASSGKENDSRIGKLQENYNAVQNNLVGLSGKVADFQTDINKLADIKVDLAAIKGDIKLQSQIVSSIKAEIKTEITSEMNAKLDAEINGIKAKITGIEASVKINSTSNLPFSFMIVFGSIMIIVFGGLIYVIFQNSQQKKELKALRFSQPAIVPFESK
jgi:hypothetical protein